MSRNDDDDGCETKSRGGQGKRGGGGGSGRGGGRSGGRGGGYSGDQRNNNSMPQNRQSSNLPPLGGSNLPSQGEKWGQPNAGLPALGSGRNLPPRGGGSNLPPLGGVSKLPALGGVSQLPPLSNALPSLVSASPPVISAAPEPVPERAPLPEQSNSSAEEKSVSFSPQDTIIGKLTDHEKQMALASLVKKPAIGKAGRPVMVTTNNYPVTVVPNKSIFLFDLKIKLFNEGKPHKKELNRDETAELFKALDKLPQVRAATGGNTWCDFKNLLFSLTNFGPQTFKLKAPSSKLEAVVTLTPAKTVNFDPKDPSTYLQCVATRVPYFATVQKGMFCTPSMVFPMDRNSSFDIGRIIMGRFGYRQAMKVTENGLNLIVDKGASAFYIPGSLLQTVQNIVRDINRFSDMDRKMVEREIKGIKAYTMYNGYKRNVTIKKVWPESAMKHIFEVEENGKKSRTNVVDYFRTKYKVTLKFPNLPLVVCQTGNIPMELILIPDNLRVGKVLNPRDQGQMVRSAAIKPYQLVPSINKHMMSTIKPCIDCEVITVNPRPLEVKGRELSDPVLDAGKPVRINCGQWKLSSLKQPMQITSTVVIDFYNNSRLISLFLDKLGHYVLRIPPTNEIPIVKATRDPVERILKNGVEQARKAFGKNPDIIFCFVDQNNEYKEIKRVTDFVLNIPSQCVVAPKFDKQSGKGYVENISMKINKKLQGINAVCRNVGNAPSNELVMICGADVTHPLPGEKAMSVVGLVATYDSKFVQYMGAVKAQDARHEIIHDMTYLMRSMFNGFYQKNKAPPARVVFYRDGVADNQFADVIRYEIPKIYDAFRAEFDTATLKLTFAVVQKRHGERFFMRGQQGEDNVMPGTVIDVDITMPNSFDFFLQSQKVLQGTGRAGRYTLLVDDFGYTQDHFQRLTYDLCFQFERCQSSISVCAPARYAHHMAFRGRDVLKVAEMSESDDDRSHYSAGSKKSDLQAVIIPDIKIADSHKYTMFYV